MIIESGVIIFAGLLLLGFKLPLSTSLRLLGRPLALDVFVSVLAFVMHYGTFTGVMAAAVAGLICSGFTTIARKSIGWIDASGYHPGLWSVAHKLPPQQKRRTR
jgi:hypothetical protein